MRTERRLSLMTALRWSLVLTVAAGLSACTAKKPADPPYPYDEGGQAAVGETDLGGEEYESNIAPGSSLDQFRQGTLGEGGFGPLDDILFGYDSNSLSERAKERLSLNAEWLRANPDVRVEIEGHCDSRGTVEYNLALGARRATSVRDHLVGLGIAAERVTTISYGKELPVCREENESCWRENRRAHFVILG